MQSGNVPLEGTIGVLDEWLDRIHSPSRSSKMVLPTVNLGPLAGTRTCRVSLCATMVAESDVDLDSGTLGAPPDPE